MAIFKAVFKAKDEASGSIKSIKKNTSDLQGGMKSLAKTMATAFSVKAVAGFAKQSMEEYAKFDRKINEVSTLIPNSTDKMMSDMKKQVFDFSKEFGVLPDEVVPSLYQALSAGIPQDNVFNFLEIANKAAVGGVSNMETAVDGLSTIVNSYGNDVIDTAKASDLMFTTVRLGKTNFDELSRSLFNVLPSASAAGISFEDVSASIATLTAQGVPTSVATTKIRASIDELSKSGTKTDKIFKTVAGKSFKQFIKEGGNIQTAMQKLEKYADSNGLAMNDLFSSVEAGSAALGLTGKATETMTKNMEEMQNAAGATETAYDKMDKGLGRSFDRMKANIKVSILEKLDELAPKLEDLADEWIPKVTGAIDFLVDNFDELATFAGVAFTAVMAFKAASMVNGFVSAMTTIAEVTGVATVAQEGLSIAMMTNPIGLMIGAVAGLAYVFYDLYTNWDKLVDKADEMYNTFQKTITTGDIGIEMADFTTGMTGISTTEMIQALGVDPVSKEKYKAVGEQMLSPIPFEVPETPKETIFDTIDKSESLSTNTKTDARVYNLTIGDQSSVANSKEDFKQKVNEALNNILDDDTGGDLDYDY